MDKARIITEELAESALAWVGDPESMNRVVPNEMIPFQIAADTLRFAYGWDKYFPPFKTLIDEAVQNKKTVSWLLDEANFEEDVSMAGNRSELAMERLKGGVISDYALDSYNERVSRQMPEFGPFSTKRT